MPSEIHRTPAARLIAIGGLSGTGKSRLAQSLAVLLAPRAVLVLRSDVERKTMFGVPETAPLEPEGYTPEVTQRVYALLAVKAAAGLAAQKHVVVDAVFSKPGERTAIECVARDAGYAFQGFWLDADIGAMRDRVAARRHDASDATVEIVEHQSGYDVGAITWHRIDAGGTTSETLQRALAVLND